jgi:corrinoid protein of di/trimethylamine methyltransferase
MTNEEFSKLDDAIRNGDEESAEVLTKQILEQGTDPLELIQELIVPTLTEIGRRFQEFEIFLPELMMAGAAAEIASEQIEAATLKAGIPSATLGKVVIGQAEGDMHDIGRNIVTSMLSAHGFKVVDLGRDVAASTFLETAKNEQADLVAISALMTTTLPAQKRTLGIFTETGERENFKIIVGGGACSPDWADQIGADGFSPDAAGAVELCKEITE